MLALRFDLRTSANQFPDRRGHLRIDLGTSSILFVNLGTIDTIVCCTVVPVDLGTSSIVNFYFDSKDRDTGFPPVTYF